MLPVKEPDPWSTNKYRPFLSYDGMVINRSTRNVSCDGILRTEPAIQSLGMMGTAADRRNLGPKHMKPVETVHD